MQRAKSSLRILQESPEDTGPEHIAGVSPVNGWQYVPAFLRDGGAIVRTVNRATPSKEELAGIFAESITPGMLALTDGLRSYNVFEDLGICQVVEATKEECPI